MNMVKKPLSQNYMAVYKRKQRREHPEIVERDKQNQRQYRLRLMNILGGRYCVKCGFNSDVRALQLDHIKGGGCQEYKAQHGKTTYQAYLFYLKRPELAKERLQVLCANCNFIKRHENGELNHHRRTG